MIYEDAVVKETASLDNGYQYKIVASDNKGVVRVEYLTPRCVPGGAELGDKGKLFYQSSASFGLWYFERYED